MTPQGRVGKTYRCKQCQKDVTVSGGFDFATGQRFMSGQCEAGHAFSVTWSLSDPPPECPFDSVLTIGGEPA